MMMNDEVTDNASGTMRLVETAAVVETAEVNFVPLEDDVGVFSGGEESYYSDNEPVPVVVEDEKIEVEAEGGDIKEDEGDDDVVIEDDGEGREGYNEWQKRSMDKRKIDEVYGDMDSCDSGETKRFVWDQRLKAAKFWRGQVDVYEGKINEMMTKLDEVREGFMAAKRLEAYQASEVKRLRKINLDRVSDVARLRERCHRIAEINGREERRYQTSRRNSRLRVQELRKELDTERQRNANLELELSNTRKRLLMFTRRSVPRRTARRVVRRIDSYEDGQESTVSVERATSDEDNEQCRMNKLITIMDDL